MAMIRHWKPILRIFLVVVIAVLSVISIIHLFWGSNKAPVITLETKSTVVNYIKMDIKPQLKPLQDQLILDISAESFQNTDLINPDLFNSVITTLDGISLKGIDDPKITQVNPNKVQATFVLQLKNHSVGNLRVMVVSVENFILDWKLTDQTYMSQL